MNTPSAVYNPTQALQVDSMAEKFILFQMSITFHKAGAGGGGSARGGAGRAAGRGGRPGGAGRPLPPRRTCWRRVGAGRCDGALTSAPSTRGRRHGHVVQRTCKSQSKGKYSCMARWRKVRVMYGVVHWWLLRESQSFKSRQCSTPVPSTST